MRYLPNEDGQGLVEYGLVIVVVAILMLVLLAILGTQIAATYQNIVDQLGTI